MVILIDFQEILIFLMNVNDFMPLEGSLWVTLGSLWWYFGSLWFQFGVTLSHFGVALCTLRPLWGRIVYPVSSKSQKYWFSLGKTTKSINLSEQ